jgi:nuclease-like protein
MAIIHNKPGELPKGASYRRLARLARFNLGGMLIAGILLGWIVALYWEWQFGPMRRTGFQTGLIVALEMVVLIAVFLGLRWLDRYSDRLAKERFRWLRGGHGEELVGWYLNTLPDTWHVFHNVKILDHCDLDHVLIGPGGLFCISTKTERGLYTMPRDGTYLLNGVETDHIREAKRLTMALSDRLAEDCDRPRWIQAVLVTPIAYIEFASFQKQIWVLHEGNLPDVFEKEKGKLSAEEIRRYANAVRKIADSAPRKMGRKRQHDE